MKTQVLRRKEGVRELMLELVSKAFCGCSRTELVGKIYQKDIHPPHLVIAEPGEAASVRFSRCAPYALSVSRVRTADRFVDISIAGRSKEQSAGFNTKDDSLSDTNDTLISSKVSFISPA